MRFFCFATVVLFLWLVTSCSRPAGEYQDTGGSIRLGTYEGTAVSSTHLLHVSSPWETGQYLSINFPEHCWGWGLPNVSHDSPGNPIQSPWSFNADSTAAVFEHIPRTGVLFRAGAQVDSMAVRLSIEIINDSDTAVTDIRTLVCFRPDRMIAFRDTGYALTWVAVDGRPVQLGAGTHFTGEMPERRPVAWALNVKGGPDNRKLPDLGWFRGKGPGRIVEECADPPLIAIRSREEGNKWIATIWHPARMLFSNPHIPCIHSDPLPPDCPPGSRSRVEGLVLFHSGTLESLIARARAVGMSAARSAVVK